MTAPVQPNEENAAIGKLFKTSMLWLYGLCGILIAVLFAQSVFVVGSQEIGLVWRFGELRGVLSGGTHFCWPYPIDAHTKFPAQKGMSVATSAFAPEVLLENQPSLSPERDGYLLCADKAIITLPQCSLNYTLNVEDQSGVIHFLTAYPDEKNALGATVQIGREVMLRRLLEDTVITISSQMTSDEIIKQPTLFNEQILSALRERVNARHIGIICEKISTQVALPPPVIKQYETAAAAQSQGQQLLSEARKDREQLLSEGRIEAEKTVAEARTAYNQRITQAKAKSEMFLLQLAEYRKAPELFKRRVRDQVFFRILANAENRYLLEPQSNGDLILSIPNDEPPKKEK